MKTVFCTWYMIRMYLFHLLVSAPEFLNIIVINFLKKLQITSHFFSFFPYVIFFLFPSTFQLFFFLRQEWWMREFMADTFFSPDFSPLFLVPKKQKRTIKKRTETARRHKKDRWKRIEKNDHDLKKDLGGAVKFISNEITKGKSDVCFANVYITVIKDCY